VGVGVGESSPPHAVTRTQQSAALMARTETLRTLSTPHRWRMPA